ncbi:acetyl-CoA synthetase-like protein [Piedraia hortae CBS 480.64]|uniref:Acetyl-CoA synthetase-like protein n=1 Tax=Piedraia hortae CBS 480.64 TaxID=1314780 RepID=A0A6A7BVK6_9PEZI|nr:acetyl-CoA synthetase-like protein [Piedraia hortae CBS 480.64]
MASVQLQMNVFLEAITQHDPQSVAVEHSKSQRKFLYGSLLSDVAVTKEKLLRESGGQGLEGERVAFLLPNNYDYVVTLLACLGSGAVAVPLSPAYPAVELRYIISQSGAKLFVSSDKFAKLADETMAEGLESKPTVIRHEAIEIHADAREIAWTPEDERGGMMLYTSGTTARPKGVLLPTRALAAQAKSLIEAWKYSPKDRLLHILPLHHIHGTVNALLTPLLAGSTIEFQFPFNVDQVWHRLSEPFLPGGHRDPITFLTAVPTVWTRLLQRYPTLPPETQTAASTAINPKNLRLNISGSAALPTPTKTAWTNLTHGNVLLERYGMTEIGMALSCGLDNATRIDGSVGWPLPGVEARLVDIETNTPILEDNIPGEIHIRGPTVFKEYFRNADATSSAFTSDGWFKTGDMAIRRPAQSPSGTDAWIKGSPYFILGRLSADIIKTGGEKVSALEVERELLSLPEVAECAVVALPSEAWGQKCAAVVVLNKGMEGWTALKMRRALADRLAPYKIPQDLAVVEKIPRNAMGKVNKRSLVGEIFGDAGRIRRRSVLLAEERRERLKREGK